MTVIARIGQKDDGRDWLASCMAIIAAAPKEDLLSVFKAQAAEGAQIIHNGLLEKQTVVDRFAQIAHSAGVIDEFGQDAVQEAFAVFGNDPPTQSNRPLSFVKASQFAGQPIPIRAWHVEELIPAGNVTLLNGDGGTGKSLIALQLAVATVLGRPWIGRPTQPGACLFLTAEDDLLEVHRRLADIVAEYDVSLADLEGLMIASLAGVDALLAIPDGRSNIIRPTGLFGALESLIEKTRPTLVVLDTLADLFGGEENQRAQARQFIGMLRGLAITHQVTVLLLAHPSLAGMASGSGSSGSTGWNNSVRSRLYLERIKSGDASEEDPDARVIKTMKANYAAVGAQIRLRWVRGAFVADGARSSRSSIAAEARADRIFLELLTRYTADGRHVSATASSNYAPALFAKDQRADGVKNRGFAKAMNRLFEAGRIKVEAFGPPSRQVKRIVVTTTETSE